MYKCDWCGEMYLDVKKHSTENGEYVLCKKCIEANDNNKCIECGEQLYGDTTINGLCNKCQQIVGAKTEKKRSEVLNGLGIREIEELSESVQFTEKDYEEWVTFGQGNFTPENREKARKVWVRQKLLNMDNWSKEDIENNMKDILFIMNNYSTKIFGQRCRFILQGNNNVTGVKIVAQKGNIIVVEE